MSNNHQTTLHDFVPSADKDTSPPSVKPSPAATSAVGNDALRLVTSVLATEADGSKNLRMWMSTQRIYDIDLKIIKTRKDTHRRPSRSQVVEEMLVKALARVDAEALGKLSSFSTKKFDEVLTVTLPDETVRAVSVVAASLGVSPTQLATFLVNTSK